MPDNRKFVGFDAYKNAMDCLKPGDVAIFATPLAFRWVHFDYAIKKGLNVFMEKPLTADGPLAQDAQAGRGGASRNLKVGVGLMRGTTGRCEELARRLQGGEIGDLLTLRAYREHGPVGSFFSSPKPADINELEWQIRRFHSFPPVLLRE